MENIELYIHIPFCVRKCNYCDFISTPADEETQDAYADALVNEIKSSKQHYLGRGVTSIYIGGGTPSLLSEKNIEKIITALRESFDLSGLKSKKAVAEADGQIKKRGLASRLAEKLTNRGRTISSLEFSIECNPGTVTKEKLTLYKKLGINRLSFGLQSAIDAELKELGRIHTARDFLDSFDLAREAGFSNINVDLMQAVPHQTLASWKKSLMMVSALRPEHISAYSLIIEEGTPFYERMYGYNSNVADTPSDFSVLLPDEDTEREIYHCTKDLLAQAGYERYEISNYALPGFECRHNLGYWGRADYLGLGLGASSLINNVRWKNTPDLNTYLNCWQNPEAFCAPPAENGNNPVLKKSAGTGRQVSLSDDHIRIYGNDSIYCEVEHLSRDDQMAEFMFLGLRKTEGITKEDFFEAFGVSYDFVYGDTTARLEADGLLEVKEIAHEPSADDIKQFRKKESEATGVQKIKTLEEIYGTKFETRIRLTEKGIDVSNRVLAEFLLG